MALLANVVQETSISTGTGNFTIAPENGRQRFSEAFATGGSDTFYYSILNRSARQWEVGTGSLSDANTLVRDTVLASSNSNALVDFGAGTKDVLNGIPQSDAVLRSDFETGISFGSGSVINFNAGDVAITHSANKLTFAGAASGYVFNTGNVGIGASSPNARLSLGATLGNTKLALWDGNATSMYGLGVQNAQFRLHLNSSSDRFSFLDSTAGTNEIVTIKGTGNVGIGTITPSGQVHIDQSSATGLKPVLYLNQVDLSEEFIRFDATDAAGNAVDSAHTPATGIVGYVRVNINGTDRWMAFYD